MHRMRGHVAVAFVVAATVLCAALVEGDKCAPLVKKELDECSMLKYNKAMPTKKGFGFWNRKKTVKDSEDDADDEFEDQVMDKYKWEKNGWQENDMYCKQAIAAYGCMLVLPKCNQEDKVLGICQKTCNELYDTCFDANKAKQLKATHCAKLETDRKKCTGASLFKSRPGALPLEPVVGSTKVKIYGTVNYGVADIVLKQIMGNLLVSGKDGKVSLSLSRLTVQGAIDWSMTSWLWDDEGRCEYLVSGSLLASVKLVKKPKTGNLHIELDDVKVDTKVSISLFETGLKDLKEWIIGDLSEKINEAGKEALEVYAKDNLAKQLSAELAFFLEDNPKAAIKFVGKIKAMNPTAVLPSEAELAANSSNSDMEDADAMALISYVEEEASHDFPLFSI